MKNIAIIYWPKKGSTEKAALKIHNKIGFDNADLFPLRSFELGQFRNYDLIIFGGSTVGADNWEDAYKGEQWSLFYTKLKKENISLKGKKVALFGMGDQILYPDDFVNDMKLLYNYFSERGAEMVGRWSAETYEHTDSDALEGSEFVGLALDEHNQPELTDERIGLWIKQLID